MINKLSRAHFDLDNFARESQSKIVAWVDNYYAAKEPPLFTSIDIRNAGFKLSPVDTNLFPAGFNNLVAEAIQEGSQVLRSRFPKNTKVVIIPENFTRNHKYFENLKVLQQMFADAGVENRLGSPFTDREQHFDDAGISIYPVKKEHDRLIMVGFEADVIVLNNDLTTEIPDAIVGIKQTVIPAIKFGWHNRKKTKHFTAYAKVVEDFAQEFSIDPWLISAYFKDCSKVDFRHKEGLGCVAKYVDEIVLKVQAKYKEYGVDFEPYVFIKADRGTYGMGMITARSGAEVLAINKKHRHSMDVIKQGLRNSEVIIQEGVPTIESDDGHPSETLAYCVGGEVLDLIRRGNSDKDETASLNSHGMFFRGRGKGRFDIKHVIAKLASLAVDFEELD
ncbi:MAG: glutamate--cysteine ligase [Rickettsiales bacterium]